MNKIKKWKKFHSKWKKWIFFFGFKWFVFFFLLLTIFFFIFNRFKRNEHVMIISHFWVADDSHWFRFVIAVWFFSTFFLDEKKNFFLQLDFGFIIGLNGAKWWLAGRVFIESFNQWFTVNLDFYHMTYSSHLKKMVSFRKMCRYIEHKYWIEFMHLTRKSSFVSLR